MLTPQNECKLIIYITEFIGCLHLQNEIRENPDVSSMNISGFFRNVKFQFKTNSKLSIEKSITPNL